MALVRLPWPREQRAPLLQDCWRRKQLSIPTERNPGTETIEVQRNIGLPKNSLCLKAYPLPPQMQQALLKILQRSDQKAVCSVFPVQVQDPPGLLMQRWFITWTESFSLIPTQECISRSLYLLKGLAGSWAWQLQTAVTFTSSSLNPSVTHLPHFHK